MDAAAPNQRSYWLTWEAWRKLPMALAQLIIMEGNKLVLTVICVIATGGFGWAMVKQIWHESEHLLDVVNYGVKGSFANQHSEVDVAREFIISSLDIADEILLAGVIVLVLQGTMQNYVTEPIVNLMTGKPRKQASALKHMSSGGMKEKVISTIAIASALYIFKLMLQYGMNQPLVWTFVVFILGGHCAFILGQHIIGRRNAQHEQMDNEHNVPVSSNGNGHHTTPAFAG